MPAVTGKLAGVNVLLSIKEASVYTVLGGQSGATLNRSASVINVTSKDGGGWEENTVGNRNWSIDCDAFLVQSDVAFGKLETAFNTGAKIDVSIAVGTGTGSKKYEGSVIIADFPMEFPQDDGVTFSLSLTGTGALTTITNP
jgi:TP901-1 family phage major tail protein